MLHVDDAHDRAETILQELLSDKPQSWRILLIKDLFARLRVILWCPNAQWEAASEEIDQGLRGEASAYWSRDVLRGCGRNEPPDGEWQDEAWQQGVAVAGTDGLRVMERQRTKEGWFEAPATPRGARQGAVQPSPSSTPSRVELDGRRHWLPLPCTWLLPVSRSWSLMSISTLREWGSC
jgi:hypothetical protein